ncbi:MAG: alpha/beta family hydrolase [Alsobacter sp.]
MISSAFLDDGPAEAPAALLLAHGAGGAMDSKGMQSMTEALAVAGLRVLRFEFAYMAARRTGARKPPPRAELVIPEYRVAVEAAKARVGSTRLVIGGKSMGGRVASMIADELHDAGEMSGLLCLGYPFHPPGQPTKTRTAHLAGMRCPALIVQGTRDPFGSEQEVAGYKLSPAIKLLWMPDGDHDLAPRKTVSGATTAGHLAKMATRVRAWVEGLA